MPATARDIFQICTDSMDRFIETLHLDSESDEHIRYKAIMGRMFVPFRETSHKDVCSLLNTSYDFYDEISQNSRYDVANILTTLSLAIYLYSK